MAERLEDVEQMDWRDFLLPDLHQILDSIDGLRRSQGDHLAREDDWANRVDADAVFAPGLYCVVAVETERSGLVADIGRADVKAAD